MGDGAEQRLALPGTEAAERANSSLVVNSVACSQESPALAVWRQGAKPAARGSLLSCLQGPGGAQQDLSSAL